MDQENHGRKAVLEKHAYRRSRLDAEERDARKGRQQVALGELVQGGGPSRLDPREYGEPRSSALINSFFIIVINI